MDQHPALAKGNVAVITGAAAGIGLAAARRFAGFGMKVVLADLAGPALDHAAAEVAKDGSKNDVLAVATDVSVLTDVQRLKQLVFQKFGAVHVLMNNAGIGNGGGPTEKYERWQKVLGVNLWGVINGVQSFADAMAAQAVPALIVNTGSKQGITCPPGDTAYNVSKAGVKVLTEALAHSLRNEEGARITAHLLIPGSTFTGMTRDGRAEKPPGAWTPSQVVDMLIAGMNQGEFYILCPDNEVTRAIDERRILWAANDIVKNRPALSRWHPDYKAEFEQFLKSTS